MCRGYSSTDGSVSGPKTVREIETGTRLTDTLRGGGEGASNLGVNSVGDLLPPSDLLRGENARGKGVALPVVRDLRGLGDDEAYSGWEAINRRGQRTGEQIRPQNVTSVLVY